MVIVDAARIAAEVAVYRLRRFEMANIAGAAAICVALALPAGEVAVRLGFAFGLNLLVYLNNDYLDLATDLRSPHRDDTKTRFLRDHRVAGIVAQVVLAAGLVATCFVRPGLAVPLVLGGGVCWAYSAHLKARPVVDILAMIAWGVAMPLCGTPVDSALGWALAGWLGLFSGVFEGLQVIRDAEADTATGVRTTAVVFGVRRTYRMVQVLLLVSAVYAALVISPWLAVLPASAVAIRLQRGRVDATWNHVRMVLGLAFLGAVGWIAYDGATAGVWLQVARETTLGR